ncbi:ExbD/TolR family protein [Zwartia panacis]|jgi:biopolymer transport protein ExbD|uniref:ExbD/TolR family protein n=1 Tax=Zwartia panacis TaxID=2683345 RepID=UPI0025B47962|nr:biopolymer transporter ExbD [Zwartia panacis]MDN4016949.1 biopolymer transporter ExbD [Zwartia panacis]
MNFRKASSTDDTPEINLIPLIDVLLVILIFLAATTTFTRERQLKISLPQAQAEQMSLPTLEVSISQDGRYAISGQLVSTADLVTRLKAQLAGQTDSVLLIRADAMSPHQAVVHAMQAAREAGISKVHFATQATQ